jgi:hypothetical protein
MTEDEKYTTKLFIEGYQLEQLLHLALKRLGMTRKEFFEAEGLDENGLRPANADAAKAWLQTVRGGAQ